MKREVKELWLKTYTRIYEIIQMPYKGQYVTTIAGKNGKHVAYNPPAHCDYYFDLYEKVKSVQKRYGVPFGSSYAESLNCKHTKGKKTPDGNRRCSRCYKRLFRD
jgi:hypothetical protein